MELNKVIHGDCLEGMKNLPADSVDCCVTDPPYGLKFMGKKWDYDIPGVEVWREAYRVLKPGAHMLVACGTRTQHRMAVNIEDAGFEIRDVICWHYGSGFPKSLDISKAIDKAIDKAAGVERKVIFSRIADDIRGGNFKNNESKTVSIDITSAESEEAIKWDGWGTALKPATEFWTMARKPLSENTIAANVVKYGTGALNIDAGRIGFSSEEDKQSAIYGTGTSIIGGNYAGGNGTPDPSRRKVEPDPLGRFPANVILDTFTAAIMDEQTGNLRSGKPGGTRKSGNNIYGNLGTGQAVTGYGDTGGASRFFKVIEWTEEDRDLERFFYVAKPDSIERGAGNTHPTVKPIALMHYLIKMICPIEVGRIVLEMFTGSGTTCIAARQLGLDFIAFEQEAQYLPIIDRRMAENLGLFI